MLIYNMVQNGKYKIYIRNTCNKYLYIYINMHIYILLFLDLTLNIQLFDYQLNENVHIIKECEHLNEEVYIISF